MHVNRVCPTLIKFLFLKSSCKIVRNIYHPAKSDEFFQKWAPLALMYQIGRFAAFRNVIEVYLVKKKKGIDHEFSKTDTDDKSMCKSIKIY